MRNMGRAHAIAVSNGGESLDVYAKHPGEHLCLHFAKLRELLGDVSDWTMMLAKLFTDRRRQRRGDISVLGERGSQGLGRRGSGSPIGDVVAVAILDGSNARLGKSGDRIGSCGLRQELERGVGEIVVRGVEGRAPGIGEREDSSRTSPSARSVNALLSGLDVPRGEQDVQVAADARRGQAEAGRQLGGRGRAVLQDRALDALPGRGVGISCR